ncbi:hypothetical protein K6U18_03580 [Vibrio fluvialis]|nr:hypothetical protein [Vibrio fluvialis]ELS8947889.1 hypothetical protein [Vibrio fluvialis]MCG6384833.1 hypothetical protein [Vibrio fluvialis]HCH6463365.1 hypothetical protein [Vibrio parahaemolyticus]
MKKESCFVIMPFAEPFETYYKRIIKPAIDENDLYTARGDSLFRSTHIMDDIWNSIKDATLVVAELTGKNPNVYYELGLAHALKKPAILIASNIDDVPFDLRPLRVLVYDKNDPDWGTLLKENISNAIKETLASPTEAIPHTFREYEVPKTPEEVTLSDRLSILENHVSELIVESFSNTYDESPKETDLNFSLGDRVVHPKFGSGTVINFEGTGRQARVQVAFNEEGIKWLVTQYAKLKRE